MVETRDGDEIDLLDSSIRTGGGAIVSTTLYVLTGVVYAAVTSPAATGTYFFAAIGIALLLRPVRGLSQTLHKIGSEPGEDAAAYLGVTVLFTVAYLSIGGLVTGLALDALTARTVLEPGLLVPAALLAVSTAVSVVTDSLFGAVGYPSYQTWLNAGQSALRLGVLLALNPFVSTAGDIMLVVAAARGVTLLPVLILLGVRPRLPTRHHIRRAWDFAKWSVPDQILDRFSYNMPTLVLGIVATPAAVGVYEAADRFADLGATISWRLSAPLLSKVSGDAASGESTFAYLDGAITGGTGVTVIVFGYLLGAHNVVAQIAFADVPTVFSTTVLLVGGVNVLRGFWTLLSHAIEGANRPDLSFLTKVVGLAIATPIPAVFGAKYGAVAGAAGYVVMNLAIFVVVAYYSRTTFGRVPRDTQLVVRLTLTFVAAALATVATTQFLSRVGVGLTSIAISAALVCLIVFVGVLTALSPQTRRTVQRAYGLGTQWVKATLEP
ncbi:lipopolysaccharide biosynthesis protein [Halobaculum sp. MBLA0147]|uniref:lipopolysaccharide biosynthesis protein n=1 Tax=Halobaculum sp. MBLA0147 TaxID=3079934 RepID=UPI003525A41A